ncbi:MAG: hypothetical protein JSS07_07380 [Proteobacteria bacterium]|nr:hypothetical protein [Pseudomonadota bacterium]
MTKVVGAAKFCCCWFTAGAVVVVRNHEATHPTALFAKFFTVCQVDKESCVLSRVLRKRFIR